MSEPEPAKRQRRKWRGMCSERGSTQWFPSSQSSGAGQVSTGIFRICLPDSRPFRKGSCQARADPLQLGEALLSRAFPTSRTYVTAPKKTSSLLQLPTETHWGENLLIPVMEPFSGPAWDIPSPLLCTHLHLSPPHTQGKTLELRAQHSPHLHSFESGPTFSLALG